MTGQYWPYVVIVVGLMMAYGYWRYFQQRKKTRAYLAMAQQRGWQYIPHDGEVPNRFTGEPFGKGFSRTAQDVLAGPHRGHQMVAFDYVYITESGAGKDRTTTHKYSVVALSTPSHRPTLELRREGVGRKLLGFVGMRDVQLESEEFNKAFLIKADNDRFAYDILHPRMMQWLLDDRRAMSSLPFRFEGGNLVTWLDGQMDLERVTYLLDYLCDVLDRVPAFVWKN